MSRCRRGATRVIALAVALVTFAGGASASAAVGDPLLPNLKATPAADIAFGTGAELRFTTLSWNAGSGALELVSGEPTSGDRQRVYQRLYLQGGGTEERVAGEFVWHPAHAHFHFEGYALYTLEGAPGTGVKRTSQKTTFCVMDTDRVDGSLPGSPGSAGYGGCNAQVQGMSVGWGDTYGAYLSGQSIDMTGMPDGDYRLTIEIDPQGRLSQSTRADDTACVLLRIRVSTRSVTVLNPNGCTAPPEASITGISPASARLGTTVAVTISGTGFTSGMAVGFLNGSGASASVSRVKVVSPTTITATVKFSRKGKVAMADPVWDLRVGTATLPDAWTVLP